MDFIYADHTFSSGMPIDFTAFRFTHLFEGQYVIFPGSAYTREDDGEFLIAIQFETFVRREFPSSIHITLCITIISNVVETLRRAV